MSESQATVMVTVLTGTKEGVKRASMEVHDVLAGIRSGTLGVVTRSFDVNFEHGTEYEGNYEED